MVKRKSNEEFIADAKLKFGDRFDYSKTIFINWKEKVCIICKLHGEFYVQPGEHLRARNVHGCKKCASMATAEQCKYSKEEIIIKFNETHNNRYDYSKINYINDKTPVLIICKIHGEFWQEPRYHLRAIHGCTKCSIIATANQCRYSKKELIEKFNKIHNNKYDYSKIEHKSIYDKIIIICPIHGEFRQLPKNHLLGSGCDKCHDDLVRKPLFIFIEQANKIHNNKYDYSKVIYLNTDIKVIIICPIHGNFQQSPSSHLNGAKCPKCSHIISKPETAWLDSLNIPKENRQKILRINNKIYRTDAYDPNTNTIYEFYGDYWHGNPNKFDQNETNELNKYTFGYLYNKTIEREKALKQAGYNLITIWESEYNQSIKANITHHITRQDVSIDI